MPNPNVPEMEQAKDLARLYVAMTRAKTQLVVSFHGQPSHLVTGLDDVFLTEDWSAYNSGEVKIYGVPPGLADLSDDTTIPESIAAMDGHQFLYTEQALGISQRLVEGLREKVGQSDPLAGRMTVAVDLGYAHQRTIDDHKARNQLGPEVAKDFQDLGVKLGLARIHRIRLNA